jgi:hypothetical protein
MTEAVSTSDMSVNLYETTQRDIPEDSHLQEKGSVATEENPPNLGNCKMSF